jgi:hypothetical protein
MGRPRHGDTPARPTTYGLGTRDLRRQPAWSVVPATVVIGAIWLEGSQGSELYHVSLLLVAPISVATDPRWTLAIACYLTLGYVIGLFGVNSVPWTELERIDDIDAQL